MALIAVPPASTSNTYINTIHVRNVAYSVPAGHYALAKVINSGTSAATGQQFFINTVQTDVWGAMTPSGGVRFTAGTVLYTSNALCYLLMEIYTL